MANGKTVKKKEKQTRKLNKSWKQHYEADGINKVQNFSSSSPSSSSFRFPPNTTYYFSFSFSFSFSFFSLSFFISLSFSSSFSFSFSYSLSLSLFLLSLSFSLSLSSQTETALKYEQRVSSLQKALSQLTQTSEKEKELHGAAQQEAEEILRERKVDEDELLFVKARMREYEKEVYGLDEAVEEAGEMRETMRGKDEEIERLLKEIDALNGEKDVVLE